MVDLSLYVDESIANAKTLPIKAFTDKGILQKELQTVFSETWLCVPKHALFKKSEDPNFSYDALSIKGNRKRYSLLGEPVFFERDHGPKGNAKLHCFLNVCPHAFYPILLEDTDERRSRFNICGQHGLKTGCDGKFISHPAFQDPSESVRQDSCLIEFQLRQWNDFYFVCRGNPRAPLSDFLKDMDQSLVNLPLNKFEYVKNEDEERIVPGNWKLHDWNYMDMMHISGGIHNGPNGLQDGLKMKNYRTELYEYSSLQWAYAANPEDGFDPELLPERFNDRANPNNRVFALWWFILPNISFNFYPWGLSAVTWSPVLDDPQKTLISWRHYVFDCEKYKERDKRWLSRDVDTEDIEAIRRVAFNVNSLKLTRPNMRGRFGANGEQGPHWFHRKMWLMAYGRKS